MTRSSALSRSGLDAQLTQVSDGVRITLTDDDGTIVFEGTYGSEGSAKASAGQWAQKHYRTEVMEVPRTARPRKGKPKSLGPTPSNLVAVMRARATDNEEKSVALRVEADRLEMEAKRLREAATALEGPDGEG